MNRWLLAAVAATTFGSSSVAQRDAEVLGDETVRLKVVDRYGAPVPYLDVDLLSCADRLDTLALGVHRAGIRFGPKDLNGRGLSTIDSLLPGQYRALVVGAAHAPTLSEPFTIIAGEVREVLVELNMGGTFRGVVVDQRGVPIEGATVRALDSFDPRPASFGSFGLPPGWKPPKSPLRTEAMTMTAADGSFALKRLAPTRYAFEIRHPAYCTHAFPQVDVPLGPGEATPITLLDGAIVSGTCRMAAEPDARLDVRLTSAHAARDGPFYSCKAESDEDAQFRLDVRIPPGVYEISASGNYDNPFDKLMDIKVTKREIVIDEGQREVTVDLVIPARKKLDTK